MFQMQLKVGEKVGVDYGDDDDIGTGFPALHTIFACGPFQSALRQPPPPCQPLGPPPPPPPPPQSFHDTRRSLDKQGRSVNRQDTSNADLTRVYDDPSALEVARCTTQLLLQSPTRALWDERSQLAQVFKGRPPPVLTYTDPNKPGTGGGARPDQQLVVDDAGVPLSMAM